MNSYDWRASCLLALYLLALYLLAVGRADAGIIIEADGPRTRRDAANTVNSRHVAPATMSVGQISESDQSNRSTRPRTQPIFSQPETTYADNLADGQFRLFSADVSQRSEAITDLPHEGSAPQQKASVIADGLRHSGDRSGTYWQADNGIQIPATPTVGDEEIVVALFALPEPSTLSLAILGAALVAATPLRRWRKRRSD